MLAENHPVPLRRVGIQDIFGRSGKWHELMKIYGLTAEDIAAKVKELM